MYEWTKYRTNVHLYSKVQVVYQICHFAQCVGELVEGFHGDSSGGTAADFLNQLLCLPQSPILDNRKAIRGTQFWYTKQTLDNQVTRLN